MTTVRPARAVDQGLAVVGVDAGAGGRDHDTAIEEPGVDQWEAQGRRQTPAESRLATPRGTVDGDDRGLTAVAGRRRGPEPRMPAAARSDDSSAGRSARASPSGSAPSSSGPTATRTRSRTSRPIAAKSRRTSRLRPSAMTTSTTESEPDGVAAMARARPVLELDAGGELLELLGGDRAVERCDDTVW